MAMVRLRKMRRRRNGAGGVCKSGAEGLEYPPHQVRPFPLHRRRGGGAERAGVMRKFPWEIFADPRNRVGIAFVGALLILVLVILVMEYLG